MNNDNPPPDVDIKSANSQIEDANPLRELTGDSRRQAVDSIDGIIYQAWWSIDAWLRLRDGEEVIYLEGAEDFDVVSTGSAKAVQVKRHKGSISLGNAKALEALENYWSLASKEPTRRVSFQFLTTSSVAAEKDGNFNGGKGIDLWRAAQTSLDITTKIANYLSTKLKEGSPLKTFLATEKPEAIQEQLIRRFFWFTEQPDTDAVIRSVDDRIAVILSSRSRPLSLVQSVKKYLESRFWQVIRERDSSKRYLTFGDALRQIEEATTVYLPVPAEKVADVIAGGASGEALLELLVDKLPKLPEPLLLRPVLTNQLQELINLRKVVLLTGTVYKGKTTLAQLVSSVLCPDAWWIALSGRKPSEVDSLFMAIARRIDEDACSSLIVIDDLDLSPVAHRAYKDSLELILHRANITGRGIILTAQGASSDSAAIHDFSNIELFYVPEMDAEEVKALCIQQGCPVKFAHKWSALVTASTGGHPKLVQVRLSELSSEGWPAPSVDSITAQSTAVTSVRQLARQLLRDTVTEPVAEFIYLLSESSVLMHRKVALKLAEGISKIANGGDVIDGLAGKWIECIESEWYRVTALLKGVSADVWTEERRKKAHIDIYSALLSKHTLDPSEVAALFFHAYMGGEPSLVANTAIKLQTSEENDAVNEVERHLLWLPFVAIDAGETFASTEIANVIIRSLQFSVACTLDADSIPQVCARWKEDVEKISKPEARMVNEVLMWMSVIAKDNSKIPLKMRLDAISGLLRSPSKLPDELSDILPDIGKGFFGVTDLDGLPKSGTTAQVGLIGAIHSVTGMESLNELLHWLKSEATTEIKQQFDQMLEWPLVQNVGAFVQTAWVATHEETSDWEPWLEVLDRLDDYSRGESSCNLGREVAKSRAIILTEYLEQSDAALVALKEAEEEYGSSAVLMEQRANVLFHVEDDKSVLEIWRELFNNPDTKETLDPFAFRRAAMSAARLGLWGEARQIFSAGADSIQPGTYEFTKFGLRVDAAHSMLKEGDSVSAAKLLAETVLFLPDEVFSQEVERWDAVHRVAVDVCKAIENSIWKRGKDDAFIEVGYASSPDLKVLSVEDGLEARREFICAQVILVLSTMAPEAAKYKAELDRLKGSRYRAVRWVSAEAQLALSFALGAGEGFVEAILSYVQAQRLIQEDSSHLFLEPDNGPESGPLVEPDYWFGLLCAGLVCAGLDVQAKLGIWAEDSRRLLGDGADLTNNIRLFSEGYSQPEILYDASADRCKRCGAAVQLLSDELKPEQALELQAFLVSGMVSDGSFLLQQLFNHHVAHCLSDSWRIYAESGSNFYSPRTSVPALLSGVDEVEKGGGTLKSLLVPAAKALRREIGEFMERVL
ncbi:hypothetical protein [Sulfuriflexus mobilis]|uniref:hypothetical protein n=1 Tax=Sulfuriflexus mobilis TaxID=1811807 RepID=UPI000F8185B6|nr:hypothetical protein [Sulfuriflexus mobilis]